MTLTSANLSPLGRLLDRDQKLKNVLLKYSLSFKQNVTQNAEDLDSGSLVTDLFCTFTGKHTVSSRHSDFLFPL